jgi:hypothetical protein
MDRGFFLCVFLHIVISQSVKSGPAESIPSTGFNGASQDLGVSFWRFCIGMDLDMKLMIFFLIRIIESIAVKSMRQSEIGDGAILA